MESFTRHRGVDVEPENRQKSFAGRNSPSPLQLAKRKSASPIIMPNWTRYHTWKLSLMEDISCRSLLEYGGKAMLNAPCKHESKQENWVPSPSRYASRASTESARLINIFS